MCERQCYKETENAFNTAYGISFTRGYYKYAKSYSMQWQKQIMKAPNVHKNKRTEPYYNWRAPIV